MAIYHLSAKFVQRSKGRSSPASAAYRSGEKLCDERQGIIHDYTRRDGVEHTEIVTPTGELIERGTLWNLAEASERRKDGVTAREYEIALPDELTPEQRRDLTLDFAMHISKRHGCAVDIAIHAPGKGDSRNHHAHLLCTTREFRDGGLGDKCKCELAERDRKKLGLPSRKHEFEAMRSTWASLANGALTKAGHVGDLDHRSNQVRGVDTPPGIHLGPTAAAMERRGVQTDRGDRQREISAVRREASRLAVASEFGERVTSAVSRVQVRRMMCQEEQRQKRVRALELDQKRREQNRERGQERGGLSR